MLWEQQAVSQNLALLRSHLDMLDRELPAANSENQQPKNQRGGGPGGALVEERLRREQQRVQRPEPYDERTFEIGVLRSRLRVFIVCQNQVLRSRLR